jgi:hypothetical protein
MANMPFFRVIYASKRRYAPQAGATGVGELAFPGFTRSATPADVLQPRIHQRVLRADRIDVFRAVDF